MNVAGRILIVVSSVTFAFPPEYFYPELNTNPPPFGNWSTVLGPITSHFEGWLERNGYGPDDFAQRRFNVYGSYGGKTAENQKLLHAPIVFFHGNEDGALAIPGRYTSGSSAQIEFLLSKGYSSAELYVTTWGDRDGSFAMNSAHSCAMMTRQRRFVEAVIEYTRARWINVLAHSMGVTVARKVAKGGMIYEQDGNTCNLGPPLTEKIGVFVGITGANYGMCPCQGSLAYLPTCSTTNGFWPGDECSGSKLKCGTTEPLLPCNQQNYSRLLREMNTDNIREGQKVYSFWTLNDDIIVNSAIAWGRPTSYIPNSELFIYRNFTHMETKEKTVAQQLSLVEPYSQYVSMDELYISNTTYLFLFFVILFISTRQCVIGRVASCIPI